MQNCRQLGFYSQSGDLHCTKECRFDTSVCALYCGDGILQESEGENCDGSDLGGQDCLSLNRGQGTLRCTERCRFDVSGCENSAVCGDGVILAPFEQCDGSNLDGATCESLGYYGGILSCGNDCQYDLSACRGFGRCGDGILQPVYETCEGSNLGGTTCESLGYYGGQLTCRNDCTFELAGCEFFGKCGDGVIQHEHESCEGANVEENTCQSLGYYKGGILSCNTDCTFNTEGCRQCGDGILQPEEGETCDGSDFGTATCETLGFYPGQLSCSSACSIIPDACGGFCGDGIVQSAFGEDCEPGVTPNAPCGQMGAGFGPVSCALACTHDSSGCTTAADIGGGATYSCAAGADGQVRCWGYNGFGQLGDGTLASRLVSVPVQNIATAQSVSSGIANHTCAVLASREVRCWGLNNHGQLGNNSIADSYVPAAVSSLTDAILVRSGGYFTCALRSNGRISCWGENLYGQLGDGTTNESHVPVQVSGINNAVSLGVGYEFACASTSASRAYCWGRNLFGQLGNGTTNESHVPVLVQNLTTVSAVAAGYEHACAVLSNQTMACWGRNQYGQLGDGTFVNASTPVMLGLTNVSHAACGYHHTCAVSAGAALCWGDNSEGQLGTGNTIQYIQPRTVSGLATGVPAAFGGAWHTCFRLTDGSVKCTGKNTDGQLGDGTANQSLTPVFAQ